MSACLALSRSLRCSGPAARQLLPARPAVASLARPLSTSPSLSSWYDGLSGDHPFAKAAPNYSKRDSTPPSRDRSEWEGSSSKRGDRPTRDFAPDPSTSGRPTRAVRDSNATMMFAGASRYRSSIDGPRGPTIAEQQPKWKLDKEARKAAARSAVSEGTSDVLVNDERPTRVARENGSSLAYRGRFQDEDEGPRYRSDRPPPRRRFEDDERPSVYRREDRGSSFSRSDDRPSPYPRREDRSSFDTRRDVRSSSFSRREDRPSSYSREERPTYASRDARPTTFERAPPPHHRSDAADERSSFVQDRPALSKDRDDRPRPSYGDDRSSYSRDRPAYSRDRDERPPHSLDRKDRAGEGRDREVRPLPSYRADRSTHSREMPDKRLTFQSSRPPHEKSSNQGDQSFEPHERPALLSSEKPNHNPEAASYQSATNRTWDEMSTKEREEHLLKQEAEIIAWTGRKSSVYTPMKQNTLLKHRVHVKEAGYPAQRPQKKQDTLLNSRSPAEEEDERTRTVLIRGFPKHLSVSGLAQYIVQRVPFLKVDNDRSETPKVASADDTASPVPVQEPTSSAALEDGSLPSGKDASAPGPASPASSEESSSSTFTPDEAKTTSDEEAMSSSPTESLPAEETVELTTAGEPTLTDPSVEPMATESSSPPSSPAASAPVVSAEDAAVSLPNTHGASEPSMPAAPEQALSSSGAPSEGALETPSEVSAAASTVDDEPVPVESTSLPASSASSPSSPAAAESLPSTPGRLPFLKPTGLIYSYPTLEDKQRAPLEAPVFQVYLYRAQQKDKGFGKHGPVTRGKAAKEANGKEILVLPDLQVNNLGFAYLRFPTKEAAQRVIDQVAALQVAKLNKLEQWTKEASKYSLTAVESSHSFTAALNHQRWANFEVKEAADRARNAETQASKAAELETKLAAGRAPNSAEDDVEDLYDAEDGRPVKLRVKSWVAPTEKKRKKVYPHKRPMEAGPRSDRPYRPSYGGERQFGAPPSSAYRPAHGARKSFGLQD